MARKDKNIFTKARWEKGKMSQTELSDIMNVSKTTIVNWESGTYQPNATDMIKLSKILDINLETLLLYYRKEK